MNNTSNISTEEISGHEDDLRVRYIRPSLVPYCISVDYNGTLITMTKEGAKKLALLLVEYL